MSRKKGVKTVKGIAGITIEISTEIEGIPYATEIDVDSDMTPEQLENIKKTVVRGFIETHKKNKEQRSFEEALEASVIAEIEI